MGKIYSVSFYEGVVPDYIPQTNSSPTFDPQFGFQGARVPREVKMSRQEMDAMKFIEKQRDYCSHLLKDYYVCLQENYPFYGLCSAMAHDHKHCVTEDYILRMKEFEREKRLRLRELRKQAITVS